MMEPSFPVEEIHKLRTQPSEATSAEALFAEAGQYGPEVVEQIAPAPAPDPTPGAAGPCKDCVKANRQATLVGIGLGIGLGVAAFVVITKMTGKAAE